MQQQHITYKGHAFQMQWCLQCHRAPERYLHEDEHDAAHGGGRQRVFNLYWKIQSGEKLSATEHKEMQGEFRGNDSAEFKKKGRELIKKYGVKVQQLSDCAVCHH